MLFTITLIVNKEHRSFMEGIYYTYYKYMLGCAYKRVGDTKQAEEIVQNTFVSLIANIEKIINQDSNKIKHYIVVTTINKCNDYFRKKQHSAIEVEGVEQLVDKTNEFDFADEDFAHVTEAVKNLKPEYRQIIVYRYYYDYDYKTIADHMAITVSYAGVLLSRALQALKKELLKRRDKNE